MKNVFTLVFFYFYDIYCSLFSNELKIFTNYRIYPILKSQQYVHYVKRTSL